MDEDAPDIWKDVMVTPCPEDTIDALGSSDKAQVLEWRELRKRMIQNRVKQEVSAELECETCLVRESIPFVRMRVHSLLDTEGKNEEAMMTLWRPTDEQLGILREGVAIQVDNLSVRDSRYEGILQLTGNSSTAIQRCTIPQSIHDCLNQYCRWDMTLYDVHLWSHRLKDMGRERRFDFDTIAICVMYEELGNESFVYLVDEFNLLLRIEGEKRRISRQVPGQNGDGIFDVVRCSDLDLLSFDSDQNCAVARFHDASQMHNVTNERSRELKAWSRSEDGGSRLQQMRRHLQTKVSPWHSCGNATAFGHVVGLKTHLHDMYIITVDCGASDCEEWEISTRLLESTLQIAQENRVALNLAEEERCLSCGPYADMLRARDNLWQFELSKVSQPEESGCDYEVNSINPANVNTLCQLFI